MAKDHQNIDNFFKDALSNYTEEQASRSVWKGISEKLFVHDMLHLNFLNIPYFVPAAMFVVAGILAILFFTTGPEISPVNEPREEVAGAAAVEEEEAEVNGAKEVIKATKAKKAIEETKATEAKKMVEEMKEEKAAVATAVTVDSRQSAVSSPQSTVVIPQSVVNNQQSTINSRDLSVEKSNKIVDNKNIQQSTTQERQKAYNPIVLSEKSKLNSSTNVLFSPISYITFSEFNTSRNIYLQKLSLLPNADITGVRTTKKSFNYYTMDQYSVGIHYTPEKMYNSPDDQPDKNIYSFDFSLIYNMNKYIFQTGIGYTYFENDHNYQVNYNDFLGTYEDLASISFTFDTVTGTPNPIYTWTSTDVYDTTDQSLTSKVTNYYSSLQVPLLLGYKLYEKKRFSLFLKGGPLVSFLIYKNEPGATYYSPDRKVTSIDYATPSRTKMNWQFMGSIGAEYQLTQRFSLAVEPTIKYYFNNIYGRNKSSDTHPYLFGVRIGVIYTIK